MLYSVVVTSTVSERAGGTRAGLKALSPFLAASIGSCGLFVEVFQFGKQRLVRLVDRVVPQSTVPSVPSSVADSSPRLSNSLNDTASTADGRPPPSVGLLLLAEPSNEVTHLVELPSAEAGQRGGVAVAHRVGQIAMLGMIRVVGRSAKSRGNRLSAFPGYHNAQRRRVVRMHPVGIEHQQSAVALTVRIAISRTESSDQRERVSTPVR